MGCASGIILLALCFGSVEALTGAAVSPSEVRLSWGTIYSASSYEIYRNGKNIGTVSGLSFNDSGLSSNTLYAYAIKPLPLGDRSAYVLVRTNAGAETDAQKPSIPEWNSSLSSKTTVQLSWKPSVDNVAVLQYKVYRNSVQVTSTKELQFKDEGLDPSTIYTYTIVAEDVFGNVSLQSEPQNSKTGDSTSVLDTESPSLPTGLAVSLISAGQANLFWKPSTDNIGVAGYRIYRNGTYLTSVTTPPYSDFGVVAGESYRYRVVAYDSRGNTSEESGEAQISVAGAGGDSILPPSEISVEKNGTNIVLRWNDRSLSETSVRVLRKANSGEAWWELVKLPANATLFIDSNPPLSARLYRVEFCSDGRCVGRDVSTDASAVQSTTLSPLAPVSFPRSLKLKSQGEDVKSLQMLLIRLGLLPTDSGTGYFGYLTAKAVAQFQEKYADSILKPEGLTVGSGFAGQRTLKKAAELLNTSN